jgi:hypothetical protein
VSAGKVVRVLSKLEKSGLDVCGLGEGPVAGSCEHDNEPSRSIKGREID